MESKIHQIPAVKINVSSLMPLNSSTFARNKKYLKFFALKRILTEQKTSKRRIIPTFAGVNIYKLWKKK